VTEQTLNELVDELYRAATELRSGDIEPTTAAELVERCADLAARAGAELDRLAREPDEPLPGQEELL
jgi:hypothetical protein